MPLNGDNMLEKAIGAVAAKITRFSGKSLGEQNTKASLIEPILASLGWDIHDPDVVHREFKPTSRDCPVDYALKVSGKPHVFIEAKGLSETLTDRKWVAQVLGYAVVAGVEWCVLTDGNSYQIYNAVAPVDAEQKLFCAIQLTTVETSFAIRILKLISKASIANGELGQNWKNFFTDRRVTDALLAAIDKADKGLANSLRVRLADLPVNEIQRSLARLIVDARPPYSVTRPTRPSKINASERRGRGAASVFGVQLIDLIEARLLEPPIQLSRNYRGNQVEAILLPYGKIDFQGRHFNSASQAAGAAASQILGRFKSKNGWAFWRVEFAPGKFTTLAQIRAGYLKSHQQND